MREGAGTLGDQGNTALGRRESEEVAPAQQHLTSIGGLGAREDAEKRALTSTGGTDEAA
jgi:hypothetical protein